MSSALNTSTHLIYMAINSFSPLASASAVIKCRNAQPRNSWFHLAGFAVAMGAFAVSPASFAADVTWSSTASSATWNTGANWVGGSAPLTTDRAFFNSSSYAFVPTWTTNSYLGLLFGAGNTNGITFTTGNAVQTLGASGIQVDSGSGNVDLGPVAFTLGATQTWVNNSASQLTTGTGALSLGIRTLTLNNASTGGFTVNGPISGSTGGVIVQGTVSLTNTNNTFTGLLRVGNANVLSTLQVSSAGSLGQGTTIQLGQGSGSGILQFDSSGGTQSVAQQIAIGGGNGPGGAIISNNNASSSNTVTFTSSTFNTAGTTSSASNRTLTLRGTNTGSNAIQGVIQDLTGLTTPRSLNVVKDESGTWVLGGINTYTGSTTVNAGSLLINGSTASGSAVSVGSGATLGGSGTIGGAVTSNGATATFTAGSNVGTAGKLNLSSTLNLTSGAKFKMDLGSSATAGTTYDQIAIAGALTGGNITFEFNALSGFQAGVTYTILTFGSSTALSYTNLSATVLPAGYTLDTSFGDNNSGWKVNGNSLQVQFAVPEPQTSFLLACGLTTVLVLRRRRNA